MAARSRHAGALEIDRPRPLGLAGPLEIAARASVGLVGFAGAFDGCPSPPRNCMNARNGCARPGTTEKIEMTSRVVTGHSREGWSFLRSKWPLEERCLLLVLHRHHLCSALAPCMSFLGSHDHIYIIYIYVYIYYINTHLSFIHANGEAPGLSKENYS